MQLQTTDIDGGNASAPAEQDENISNADLRSATASSSGTGCAIAGTHLDSRGSEKTANVFAVSGNVVWDNLDD